MKKNYSVMVMVLLVGCAEVIDLPERRLDSGSAGSGGIGGSGGSGGSDPTVDPNQPTPEECSECAVWALDHACAEPVKLCQSDVGNGSAPACAQEYDCFRSCLPMPTPACLAECKLDAACEVANCFYHVCPPCYAPQTPPCPF